MKNKRNRSRHGSITKFIRWDNRVGRLARCCNWIAKHLGLGIIALPIAWFAVKLYGDIPGQVIRHLSSLQ